MLHKYVKQKKSDGDCRLFFAKQLISHLCRGIKILILKREKSFAIVWR